VYSEWVDACDAVAKENSEDTRGFLAPSRRPLVGRSTAVNRDDDDQDLGDDEHDIGGYEGDGIVGDDEY
jgi:hypothetical protein